MAFNNIDIDEFEDSAGRHCMLAREAFEKATEDSDFIEDTLFHIAQCAETILKTLILASGYQPPRDRDLFIHNVDLLWGLYDVEIDGEVQPSEFLIDAFSSMKDWSTDSRYHTISYDLQDLAVLLEELEEFYWNAYDYLEGF